MPSLSPPSIWNMPGPLLHLSLLAHSSFHGKIYSGSFHQEMLQSRYLIFSCQSWTESNSESFSQHTEALPQGSQYSHQPQLISTPQTPDRLLEMEVGPCNSRLGREEQCTGGSQGARRVFTSLGVFPLELLWKHSLTENLYIFLIFLYCLNNGEFIYSMAKHLLFSNSLMLFEIVLPEELYLFLILCMFNSFSLDS